MKSNYMNYFKEGKLYQWDKNRDIFTISKTNIQEEFCLDQKGMDMFLKFDNPEIKLDKTLQVKSGNLKANINVCNETLIMPNMDFTSTFKLSADELKIANKFVGTNEKRPILQGVNVENGRVSATDSFSAFRSKNVNVESGEHNITISSQFINSITKFKGDITVKCNDNSISFEVEDVIYIGKLLAGNYPNLSKLFIKNSNNMKFSKKELKDLLSYSNDKKDVVIFENNKLTIKGDNVFEVDIDLDINCKICVQLERLMNVISCIDDEEITISYEDGARPLYINEQYLVLPIKLND